MEESIDERIESVRPARPTRILWRKTPSYARPVVLPRFTTYLPFHPNMSSGLSPHPQASHATPSSTANLLPQPSIASLNDSPSKANPFSNAKGAGTSGGGGGGSGLTPLPFQGTSPPFASSPNALRTPSNLNSNAAAMDLLSKARLAAGLNHGSSSPFTNQQAQALLFGQTPMPSTSALLVPPPSSSSSNHSRARLIEQECEEFERAVAALEALAEGFYNQL